MEKDKKSVITETLEESDNTDVNDDTEPMEKEDYDDVLPAKVTPKKKEKWVGLSPAKKAHMLKLNEANRQRFKAEKEAKTQLLQDAKDIVKARRTIKEMDIKEQENKKLLEKAAKIVRGKGRPKKTLPESESEEEEVVEQVVEESEEEVVEQVVEESEEEVMEKPKKSKPAAKKKEVKKTTKPVKEKVKKPRKKPAKVESSSSEEEEELEITPPGPRPRQFSFFV